MSDRKYFMTLYILFFLICLLGVSSVFAAASEGMKWDPVTTYPDGTKIDAATPLVYMVYDSTTVKQVASSRTPTVSAAALPTDGCYFVKAALWDATTNGYINRTLSLGYSPIYCTKPAPKPVSNVTNVTGTG